MLAGTEWYDFALYGYLAPIIGTLLFPADDPVAASLLAALAVVSFIALLGLPETAGKRLTCPAPSDDRPPAMITRGHDLPAPRVARGTAYLAFAAAGFRRYTTYRQAMVAAIFTNSIFGFLRCSVLLALAGAGTVAGYDEPRLATFVWAGQGLIGVVLLWSPNELADRIRTGDVIADLLRPVDLVWQLLAADLGRAGLAVFTRFVGPVVVGALAFHLYAPRRPTTYVLFACSMLLATIVCFGCRFLVNAAAYWLLDARGPQVAWTLLSAVLGGLYFPLWFLPRGAVVLLIAATPFPSLIQLPLDVLVERGPPGEQLMWLAVQAVWAATILALCRWVQRRGERKLVVQGG